MNLQENVVVKSLDALSYGAVIGALAGILPPIAALFSIIWICTQLYDRWKKQHTRVKTQRRRATDT